jgi:hypothetical protein
MKLKRLATMLAVICIQPVYSASIPTICPSVAAIHAAGVNKAYIHPVYNWMASNSKNKFATEEDWTLVVMLNRNPRNEEEAINITNASLASLMFDRGPEQESHGNDSQIHYVCSYLSDADGPLSFALTITPAMNDIFGIMSKFKRK